MLAKASASDVQSNFGQSGLDWFSLSAANPTLGTFANILNTVTPNANATAASSSTDPIAQLAALVQSGTPLSTIVNTIAQNVSASVQQQLSGTMSQSALDNLRSSLLQSITNALSPPSNAPPGSATQQVTALAARLQRLINAVARETKTTAGQQNEIAGHILDAKSAKELPAQQKTNGTSSPLDVSSLVRSILSNAVVALHGAKTKVASGPPASTTPKLPTPVLSTHTAPAHTAPAPLTFASIPQASPSLTTALHPNPVQLAASAASVAEPASQPAAPVSLGVTPASSQAPTDAGSASSITIANAPDLLARMLVRASGADAVVSGSAGAATAQIGTAGSDSTNNVMSIADRFAAAVNNGVADGIASASPSQDGQASANGFSRGSTTDDQAAPTTQSASSSSNVGVAVTTANAQLQNLVQPQQVAASSVDVNAVLEQMIKSMSMRTNAQGTSEIRLHLQPENLGDVTMKITVTGSQISANVIAQNADVRSALVSNHHQLAKSLADAGMTLTGFSVDVSGGDAKQQNQGQMSGFGRRYVVHELGAGAANEESTVSNLGPPLLSGAGIGLFNYLA